MVVTDVPVFTVVRILTCEDEGTVTVPSDDMEFSPRTRHIFRQAECNLVLVHLLIL